MGLVKNWPYPQPKSYYDVKRSQKPIVVNQGGSRCFVGDTLVQTSTGHKAIKDIESGEWVLSMCPITGEKQYRTVVKKYRYEAGQVRQNMITFVFYDGTQISCTDTHEFYYQGEWLSASALFARTLQTRKWNGRPVLGNDPRQAACYELEAEGRLPLHEAGPGRQRVPTHNDLDAWQVQHRKNAPAGSPTLPTKFPGQGRSKPYQFHANQQLCGQFGMGDEARKLAAYNEPRTPNSEQRRQERHGEIDRAAGSGYKGQVQTVEIHKEPSCSRVRRFGSMYQGCSVPTLGSREINLQELASVTSWSGDVPVYDLLLDRNHNYTVTEHNIIVHNSGKTYSTLQVLCEWCQDHPDANFIISVVRKTSPSLKASAYRDFLDILHKEGWYHEKYHNKTSMEYVLFGNTIEFFAVDNQQKLRGRRRHICFVNEANELTQDEFFQLNVRTEFKMILDFNPSDEYHWLYELQEKYVYPEFEQDGKTPHPLAGQTTVDFFKTNYTHNPHLPYELIQKIEQLEKADPDYWKVFGMGLRGASRELIFTHWQVVDALPGMGETVYGQDFGFNAPSALVKVEFFEGAIYAQQKIYQTKLTTHDLADLYPSKGIGYGDPIYCDAAAAESLEELDRFGYNAIKAQKDVLEGIRKLKSMPLFITSDSVDLIKEMRNYKWKKDPVTERVLDEPVKWMDHACFVGSTLISTARGPIRIDAIKKGDLVLTEMGYKKVIDTFDNGCLAIREYRIRTANFTVVVKATPDHLIKVNGLWQPISSIQQGDTINLCKSLEGNDIPYTTENVTFPVAPENYTFEFGAPSTMRHECLKATISIMRMKIRGTMNPLTLFSKKAASTYLNTPKKGLRKTKNGLPVFIRKASKRQKNGMHLSMAKHGTESMRRIKALETSILALSCVGNAVANSKPPHITINSVVTHVNLLTGENQAQITNKEVACIAKTHSPQTNTRKHYSVAEVTVLSIVGTDAGKANVYDIEVEDAHQYFANGILAHNCDALRYAVYSHQSRPRRMRSISI